MDIMIHDKQGQRIDWMLDRDIVAAKFEIEASRTRSAADVRHRLSYVAWLNDNIRHAIK